MIYINVVNQRLAALSSLKNFVEGSQEFVRFAFNLDDTWSGLRVFAQFTQNGVAYNQYLDDENSVYLPAEIETGTCTLMLYGTGSTTIGTTNYLTLNIGENKYIGDAQSTEITQSLYQQLVNAVNNYESDTDAEIIRLDNRITSEISQVNSRITSEVSDINADITHVNDRITAEVSGLTTQLGTKVKKPTTNPNGSNGQVLRTKGNGETEWATVGTPTDAQTATAVTAWLNAHPEATTTVQDGSITKAKLSQDALAHVTGTTLYL